MKYDVSKRELCEGTDHICLMDHYVPSSGHSAWQIVGAQESFVYLLIVDKRNSSVTTSAAFAHVRVDSTRQKIVSVIHKKMPIHCYNLVI